MALPRVRMASPCLSAPFVLLAVLLVLVAAGCSDAEDADGLATPRGPVAGPGRSRPATIDVCALLSQEEVESVVERPVGEPVPEAPVPPFFGCRYDNPAGATVTIGVIAYEDAEAAAETFEAGLQNFPTEVPGIGDRAYNAQPINDLTVLAGRYEVTIGLYFVSQDPDTEIEMSKELATLVINRLP